MTAPPSASPGLPVALTRRAALAAGALAPVFWALDGHAQERPADPQLAALAEDYYRQMFALFPLDATESLGDPAYEAALEIDIAPAHLERQAALYRQTLERVRGIPPARLNRTDRVTHAVLQEDAGRKLEMLRHPWHLLPVNPLGSVPVQLAQWADGKGAQPLKTVRNYENFLQRLQRVSGWVDQAIANMEEGIARGITLPRPLVERVLQQLEGLLPQDPYASPYLAGVRQFPPAIPEADRTRLAAVYRVLVFDDVNHALRRLRSFLAGRYLPQARQTAGFGALPGGAAWYQAQVRWSTTTEMTPREIHALGQKEVARIRTELGKVKSRLGDARDLATFLRTLPARTELRPFRSEAEVLAAFRALNDKVKPGLARLFERSPRAPLDVRLVDPVRRDTASNHYVPPAADGSRPGVFYAVVRDPAAYLTPKMTALFLHEGQPGHHYQIGLQQELDVPRIRKVPLFDSFTEGWALYAEGLGRELGLYEDAVPWLGRLQMELHRAVRLVVDTGLHELGWSRERAMEYMVRNEGADAADARRAIERYMAWPGQALAYKVGELKLLELRERARQRLGDRFDIRAFHAQVLGDGAIPLKMLEAKIDGWLAGQR